MKTIARLAIIAIGFALLCLLMTGIDFIGENFGDILGPIALFAGIYALAAYIFKKGN